MEALDLCVGGGGGLAETAAYLFGAAGAGGGGGISGGGGASCSLVPLSRMWLSSRAKMAGGCLSIVIASSCTTADSLVFSASIGAILVLIAGIVHPLVIEAARIPR